MVDFNSLPYTFSSPFPTVLIFFLLIIIGQYVHTFIYPNFFINSSTPHFFLYSLFPQLSAVALAVYRDMLMLFPTADLYVPLFIQSVTE